MPDAFGGLVSFWDGSADWSGGTWKASLGAPYELAEQRGPIRGVHDPSAPFGKRAIKLEEGQWLSVPRAACPRLDFHGSAGVFTLVAWMKRARTAKPHCEFIAGQWNETDRSRQYGLFININMWKTHEQLCGHLSHDGGPTAGYRFCADGPIGATPIDHERWHCLAVSYDGTHGYAWLDGVLDANPRINPYLIPGGLHDGGPGGSDFTVGAVHRGGEFGNFFAGLIGGIAVYDRVLTPAEMWALADT